MKVDVISLEGAKGRVLGDEDNSKREYRKSHSDIGQAASPDELRLVQPLSLFGRLPRLTFL